jgi:hypothetical protein
LLTPGALYIFPTSYIPTATPPPRKGGRVNILCKVYRSEEIKLVSPHLILAISKQPGRAPEKVLRKASPFVALEPP